jgi:hypothetical protein
LRNHACQKGSTGLFAKRVACTRRDIAEIVANVAVNTFTNYFNHVARMDVDHHVIAALNAIDPNLPKMRTAGTSPTTELATRLTSGLPTIRSEHRPANGYFCLFVPTRSRT